MAKLRKFASRSLNKTLSFLLRIPSAKQIPVLMTAQEKLQLSMRGHLMKENSSSSLLGDAGEGETKSKVRVYKFRGILKGEFSNIKEARQYAASMAEKHPNLLFEPYMDRRSGNDRRSGSERRDGSDRRSRTDRRKGIQSRTV